ncbi:hypothetical protein MBLNU459_g7418t1 [Dothideomycetes sp. NU459]
MRFSLAALLPALACLVHARSALEGDLHMFEVDVFPTVADASSIRTVDPETARLVIASRLGLDRYHSLGRADGAALQAINDFSAQDQLFAPASASDSIPPVALVLATGVDVIEAAKTVDTKDALSHQQLHISNIPCTPTTEDLVMDLAMQSGMHSVSKKELKSELVSAPDGTTFAIVDDQESFARAVGSLIRQNYVVLALSAPRQKTCKHTYGSFDMSSEQSSKRKRQQEAPLVTESDPTQSSSPKPFPVLNIAANSSAPLRGILPQCFSSLSSCQSMTRNCTGHGSCSLKFTDRDASNNGAPCYSCVCTADVRTTKNGKKTTQWGGPACQKKNVVTPFWLLAGFTVIMVFLITWGVGLLWSMGEEELPSVIGAGVSGVSKK